MASEKITAILDEIKGLSILELKELIDTYCEEFGVSAVAAAPAAAAGAAPAPAVQRRPSPLVRQAAEHQPHRHAGLGPCGRQRHRPADDAAGAGRAFHRNGKGTQFHAGGRKGQGGARPGDKRQTSGDGSSQEVL